MSCERFVSSHSVNSLGILDQQPGPEYATLDVTELYRDFDTLGLTYGSEFQGIINASIGTEKAKGIVQVTDTCAGMPGRFEYQCVIHPSTMDAFLQVSIIALCNGEVKNLKHAYVPTFIEEVSVSQNTSSLAGEKFEVYSNARMLGFREAIAYVKALQINSTQSKIEMRGIKCLAINTTGSGNPVVSSKAVPKHCYAATWEADIELVSKEDLNSLMRKSEDKLVNRIKDMELVAWYFINKALRDVAESEVVNMHPHHKRLYDYMKHQRDLFEAKTHEQQTDEWIELSHPATEARIQAHIQKYRDPGDYESLMFTRMGSNLAPVLRQEVEPLSLMMENDLLYDYYTVALGVKRTYRQVAKYIHLLSHKNPNLKFLEVGAGTGGLTAPVLHALRGQGGQNSLRLQSYTYTDISTGFFEKAEDKFADWKEVIQFKKLDIEKAPASQGFADGSFDVVLAANVLHATFDIESTITKCRSVLRPGGKLILLDMTHSLMSVSLIWGTLPGWWNCRQSWRKYGPLLNERRWEDLLTKNGFSAMEASTADFLDPLQEGTRVMISSAVELNRDSNSRARKPISKLLIVVPEILTPKIDQASSILEDQAAKLGLVAGRSSLTSLQSKQSAETVVISFVEYDDAMMSSINESDYVAVQNIIKYFAGLLWVARGGLIGGTQPELSLFQGFARSVRSEEQGFTCATIDLEANHATTSTTIARHTSKVFEQLFLNDREGKILDHEYVERDGILCVKRVIAQDKLNRYIAARTNLLAPEDELKDLFQSDRHLKVKIRCIGALESLVFDDDVAIDAPVPEGQVEVEVHAVGLNFRDVLISMGEISDDYLGNECAGVVTKLGKGVKHLKVGDRVAAWCLGSFSTRIRNSGCCVQQIPDDMSFSVAAALPLVFVTAYYGLIRLGRLSAGETVLIHAAAGGVGQAAIQVAQMVGAKIFATAGTAEKRKHIAKTYGLKEEHIFSSRDISFTEDIGQATDGRGVDVVLNSLAGDLLHATWQCIAPVGRFIEIGKKDINMNRRLEMQNFSKNTTFSSVDVTLLLRQNLQLAKDIFTAVMNMVRNGNLRAPVPLTTLPFSKMEESFRQMQSGKHLGKIVLEIQQGDLVPVIPRSRHLPAVEFPSDATYLLAGGFGGLGCSIARWMVAHGAKNLIFASRNGATSADSKTLIQYLKSAGVCVSVIKCCIEDSEQLSEGILQALRIMPPLRGVFQAAMMLKDQVFANMSHDTFMKTIRPKVQGSWALHKATLGCPLDFFVLLSSVASFIGNAGQSNYVAACAYQVALATHRNSLGLPATAIDIGKVKDVGFVAERTGTVSERNLSKMGMLEICEDELLAMMEIAIKPTEHGVQNGHIITGLHSTLDTSNDLDSLIWARDPVFSHLDYLRQHPVGNSDTTEWRTSMRRPLTSTLTCATSITEAVDLVLQAMICKISRATMISAHEIDPSKSTSDFGIDSLIAVEIRNWITREAKVDIPIFAILQATSLMALANQIMQTSSLVSDSVKMSAH